MILTEKEACKKDCPYKYGRDPAMWVTFCSASECMAWRWIYMDNGEHFMKKECDGYADTGYCGLAGDPSPGKE